MGCAAVGNIYKNNVIQHNRGFIFSLHIYILAVFQLHCNLSAYVGYQANKVALFLCDFHNFPFNITGNRAHPAYKYFVPGHSTFHKAAGNKHILFQFSHTHKAEVFCQLYHSACHKGRVCVLFLWLYQVDVAVSLCYSACIVQLFHSIKKLFAGFVL